jgi:hypothetical protein
VTGIIITFLAAFFGLCFLWLFALPVERTSKSDATLQQAHPSVPGLSAMFCPDLEIFLRRDDYHKLSATPELKPVAAKFLKDRRRIVLMWLGELEGDVRLLWEFRRFLVRNGLSVTLKEEAGVACTGLLALIYLRLIRGVIFLFGPFALPGALRNARSLVQPLATQGIVHLARVPASRKAEIERKWAQHLSLVRAG